MTGVSRTGHLTAALALGLLLSACGSADPDEPAATSTPEASPTVSETAVEPIDLGPTDQEQQQAAEIVSGMSRKQQAGQVIVARYQGTEPPIGLVNDLHLGGVIVMGDNVGDVGTLAERNQRLADSVDSEVPLVIAVDQEGGIVARVGAPATEFPTFMSHGSARDESLTRAAAAASGRELRALGFTMVYAPVADVTIGPSDPTIGSRAASSDPDLVAAAVVAAAEGYDDAGIVSVTKHFPGHGSVPADSHEQLPVQTRTAEQLAASDLVPFEAAVEVSTPSVMVAHIDVREVDPGTPASLSSTVIDGMLRDELGYQGLVSTDALDMGAIVENYGSADAAVRALKAGADVLLMPVDPGAARDAVVEAVKSGRVPPARLTEAAERMVATMLHQQATADPSGPDEVGANSDVSREVSAAAVAIVSGSCQQPLVTAGSVRVSGGTDTDRQRFVAAAEAAGLETGSGPMLTLLGVGAAPGSGDIVVALDSPWVLGDSTASVARIALFGRTPEAFAALVDVLLGDAPAPGRLPVQVQDVQRNGCG